MHQEALAHRSTAAEIKTGLKAKTTGKYLPQLWFGRTPWLITGQHKQGTFNEARLINAVDEFEE